jgi:hypothetical protein
LAFACALEQARNEPGVLSDAPVFQPARLYVALDHLPENLGYEPIASAPCAPLSGTLSSAFSAAVVAIPDLWAARDAT